MLCLYCFSLLSSFLILFAASAPCTFTTQQVSTSTFSGASRIGINVGVSNGGKYGWCMRMLFDSSHREIHHNAWYGRNSSIMGLQFVGVSCPSRSWNNLHNGDIGLGVSAHSKSKRKRQPMGFGKLSKAAFERRVYSPKEYVGFISAIPVFPLDCYFCHHELQRYCV